MFIILKHTEVIIEAISYQLKRPFAHEDAHLLEQLVLKSA